ncbi:pyrroline-5-carboxylate reductase (plasmid) [Legionella adelaidensis]|uniref:Pyrroline-5-carboxylate reductase n=1 Tax=Legionella adelaidensis TaxID=45056 RepID=A0A0W0R2W9_9GAMM|nr:pyrroline-5-carboxylate reductase [Legionella adelaidensis]KTC65425.1 pyrroline-5-carboxylate reductase [Legionella adelaidensis]VEH84753.1 pyrroline-5-carboxylate reductase [Legionella adelaidensis]
MNVTFVGFGNMGKAIAQGLKGNGKYTMSATSPSLPVGVNADNIATNPDNTAFISRADIVILAVKPVQMRDVVEEIKPFLLKKTLIISVAAGISIQWFAQNSLSDFPLVRAMPNIAASLLLSATPLFANSHVNKNQLREIEDIFNTIGITTWVKEEKLLDTFTALSGSGPAYFFEFLSVLVKGATQLGLPEEIAHTFTLQTMRGALHLASANNQSFSELKKKVTSKKGTTEAALDILLQRGFEKIIIEAMQAAYHRAQEIGQLQEN